MLNVKKINVADFSSANTADMQKLARSLNPFFDSIGQAINKGLTVSENLPFEYVNFEVTVDLNGNPKSSLRFSTALTANIQGALVIQASASNSAPIATPFIVFTVDKNIITVSKIVGLPANIKFKITALVLS